MKIMNLWRDWFAKINLTQIKSVLQYSVVTFLGHRSRVLKKSLPLSWTFFSQVQSSRRKIGESAKKLCYGISRKLCLLGIGSLMKQRWQQWMDFRVKIFITAISHGALSRDACEQHSHYNEINVKMTWWKHFQRHLI